jgi:hypothetical protein
VFFLLLLMDSCSRWIVEAFGLLFILKFYHSLHQVFPTIG